MLWKPALRAVRRVAAVAWGEWMRSRKVSSAVWKDWAPMERRVTPAWRRAWRWASVVVPGLTSRVISALGAMGAIWRRRVRSWAMCWGGISPGVPPPNPMEAMVRPARRGAAAAVSARRAWA